MNPFSSGSVSSTSVWRMNRAGWFLVDAISVFLALAEVGGKGDGGWPIPSLAGCMRLAAEFSIRVISYGVVLEGVVGKGSTPWLTDTSDGES